MLLLNRTLGNQFGHRQRQAAGGQCQSDAVNTVSNRVDTITDVSQQVGHGDPVKNADQPYQDAGNGKNASLPQQVVFSLCRHVLLSQLNLDSESAKENPSPAGG